MLVIVVKSVTFYTDTDEYLPRNVLVPSPVFQYVGCL